MEGQLLDPQPDAQTHFLMFRKKQRTQPEQQHAPDAPRLRPALPRLLDAINVLPRILEIFRDNRGKMSSKRFGAGAMVAAGIALVDAGAEQGSGMHFYGGLALCALGVVLFGLTRWESFMNDQTNNNAD